MSTSALHSIFSKSKNRGAPGSTQLWEKPAVYAAVKKFLDSTDDYVWDRDIEYYAYSQHMYLRRVKETLPLRKLEEFVKPET